MTNKPTALTTGNSGGSVERRAGLRSWKPGVSGNPRGRPKVAEEVRTLARAHGQRALERLVELIDDPDPRVAFMAAKEILDRGFGRPAPAEEDADERTVVVQIVHIEQAPSSSS